MNNNDPFSQLWQQQRVSGVNVNALKRQWRKTRVKQWAYFSLDLIATLVLPVVAFVLYPKLSKTELVWFGLLGVICFGSFAYLVWLRRYSLGFGKDRLALNNYIELVKAQYQQNIKIARLSKLSTWLMPVIMLTFWALSFFTHELEPEVAMRKLKFTALILLVLMPLTWVWAHKREQKFMRALHSLEEAED